MITLKYRTYDRVHTRRNFKKTAGAKKFALDYIGEEPEIKEGRALSKDGMGSLEIVEGITFEELFKK
jgi:hypothetical protein